MTGEADDDASAQGARPSSAFFPEGEPLLRSVGVTARLGGNQILRGIDLSVLWAMLAFGVLLRLFHFV